MRLTPSRQRGFTLIELVAVMTILALLATVGLAGYRHKTQMAREAVLKENLFQLNHALEQFRADRGKYPSNLGALRELHYLRDIPVDPMTRSKDTWQTELEPPDPDNPDAEVGIFRVRSGSTDKSEDGIPYNEW
ncbi:type II secretion system pseudopilin OxpG [Geothrix oryzae]|jgi:prepilin-type N-terminal cleavage/methylation domain-containing protein|uniref:Type II secretion system pseudopilin OxpG n=1 Tax=Geothrix oryzae TaxID=2927975 RepID=A0ABM8DTK0_9BACT|nr:MULTISPECIES: type II secretion system protein [Geothrix]BDU70389.1 type II secretion system pseudopilin OxpG [Geothrix oryzae]